MSLQEAADILEKLERYKQTHRLEYYKPYEYQKKFHNAIGHLTEKPATQKALMAANQVGKCVSIRLNVPHPDGSSSSVGKLARLGKPFKVLSWNGERLVEAMALPPFKKKAEPIYRVYLESGDYFECAGAHRVLGEDGWQHVSHFLASARNLPESIWERALSIHAEDVRRWFETLRDFLAGCLSGFRSCGVQLPRVAGTVAVFAPSQVDALERTSISSRTGESASRYRRSFLQSFVHRASSYVCRQIEGRSVGSIFRILGNIVGPNLAKLRVIRQRAVVGVVRLRLNVLAWRGRYSASSFECPIKANKIIAYSLIGCDDIYDFTVPEYENYFAAGVIHHNTTCGAMEVAIHATGLYPKWWEGTRFTHATEWVVASTTNETTRDRCQKDLFGEPTEANSIGTGAVPLDTIIGKPARKPGVPDAFDSALIRHVSGGTSKLVFRAYEQGPKKFMGSRLTGGYWADEEPPPEIFSQLNRGIIATNGIGVMTFTPEEGMTEVVAGLINDIQQGQALIRATWDDAPHMTLERRELALRRFPAHERDMRSKGEPLMGSGRVFDIQEDMILCEPFEIPRHWARINGLDFGWDHPAATSFAAHDRDKDAIYIYDGWRQSRTLIPVHAQATKANGEWIPCAWPHDGLVHDKQSGKIIADLYRDCGVNMWREPFTNPPPPGMDEGKGGNGVEAGIFEMLEMMQTGRFKVFSTVKPWWEEMRMYHRQDGKIVAKMDDFISATRIAVMFRRHAQTRVVRQPKVYIPAGVRNW